MKFWMYPTRDQFLRQFQNVVGSVWEGLGHFKRTNVFWCEFSCPPLRKVEVGRGQVYRVTWFQRRFLSLMAVGLKSRNYTGLYDSIVCYLEVCTCSLGKFLYPTIFDIV